MYRHSRINRVLLLAFVAVVGCSSSGEATSDLDPATIPDGAFVVLLQTSESPEDYLLTVRRGLESEGFEIVDYSPAKMSMSTVFADIGRQKAIMIFASVSHDEMTDTTIGQFSAIVQSGQAETRWSQNDDDQSYGFLGLAKVVREIRHDKLNYAVR